MKDVKIDKGVPIPAGTLRGGSTSLRAVLDGMEVGDSFIFPAKDGSPVVHAQRSVSSMAYTLRPKRFATRTVIENDVKVLRIWRVE